MTELPINALPTLNAALNSAAAFLLAAGYLCIRSRKVQPHRLCMTAAFLASILFLASYLAHHALHGAARFQGTGLIRRVYLGILLSHTLLAMAIVPLAIRTLFLALRSRFEEHRRIARWTFPLWLYVSATGVAVYGMVYR